MTKQKKDEKGTVSLVVSLDDVKRGNRSRTYKLVRGLKVSTVEAQIGKKLLAPVIEQDELGKEVVRYQLR